MNNSIIKRQNTNKKLIVEQLKKTPIVLVVCQKLNISRASYYRWRRKDQKFAENADKALLEGKLLINDLAVSKLITAIKNNSLGAIVFWLKHNHKDFTTKVEVNAKLKMDKEILNPQQEALVQNALKLAGLLTASKKGEKENDT